MECGAATRVRAQPPSSHQPTPTVQYVEMAELALQSQNWREADEYFNKALENNPANARAWVGKAISASRRRDITEIIRRRLGSEITPDGIARQVSVKDVLVLLRKALQVEPENPEALLLVGYLTDDPSLIEKIVGLASIRPVALEALKRLAAKLLRHSLTLKLSSSILGGSYGFFAVKDNNLWRKALAISVVQGRVDGNEILNWRFPLKWRSREAMEYSYTAGHPENVLDRYLRQQLELSDEGALWTWYA